MIQVKYHPDGSYIVRMDNPEAVVVAKIGLTFSISKEAAVAAIVNRGMDSIGKQIERADAGITLKQVRDGNG